MRFEALSPRCDLQLAGRAQNIFSKANSYLWKGFDFSLHENLGVLRQQGMQASAFLWRFASVVLSVSNLSRRRCQEVTRLEEEPCSYIQVQYLCFL